MSRDQGSARGQMPYAATRCTCGHWSTLHTLPDPGRRGPCSASTCDCRRFDEADQNAIGCPRCAFVLEVSDVDPDATLSDMHSHLLSRHYDDPTPAMKLLAYVREVNA